MCDLISVPVVTNPLELRSIFFKFSNMGFGGTPWQYTDETFWDA